MDVRRLRRGRRARRPRRPDGAATGSGAFRPRPARARRSAGGAPARVQHRPRLQPDPGPERPRRGVRGADRGRRGAGRAAGDELRPAVRVTNTGRAFWPAGRWYPYPAGSVTLGPVLSSAPAASVSVELGRTTLPRSRLTGRVGDVELRVPPRQLERGRDRGRPRARGRLTGSRTPARSRSSLPARRVTAHADRRRRQPALAPADRDRELHPRDGRRARGGSRRRARGRRLRSVRPARPGADSRWRSTGCRSSCGCR